MVSLEVHRIFFTIFAGPPGGPQYRALGLGQRPFIDGFPKTFHELESLRRSAKAAAATTAAAAAASAATSAASVGNALTTSAHQLGSSYSSSNSTINSDCQVYKPNAPQIQGKTARTELLPPEPVHFPISLIIRLMSVFVRVSVCVQLCV